jgi:NADP-dependent 3-hydroxy acid dehydrogenase YdfG
MERLAGNVAVITGGSGGIALAPRHYFAERAPQLPLLVTSRRRSIRQLARLATAYELLCRTLGNRAGAYLLLTQKARKPLGRAATQTFSAGSPCRIFQTQ